MYEDKLLINQVIHTIPKGEIYMFNLESILGDTAEETMKNIEGLLPNANAYDRLQLVVRAVFVSEVTTRHTSRIPHLSFGQQRFKVEKYGSVGCESIKKMTYPYDTNGVHQFLTDISQGQI